MGAHELDEFMRETIAGEAGGFVPTPNALLPLVENTVNYSFFLRRPIVPGSEQGHPAGVPGGPVHLRGRAADRAVDPRRAVAPEDRQPPLRLDGRARPPGHANGGSAPRGLRSSASRRLAPRGRAGDPGVMDPVPGFSSESVERFYELYREAQVASSSLRFLERAGNDQALLGRAQQRRLRPAPADAAEPPGHGRRARLHPFHSRIDQERSDDVTRREARRARSARAGRPRRCGCGRG